MILRALHRIASLGPVYDLIQTICGAKFARNHFRRVLETYPGYQTVLDIGGGTGRIRSQLSADCTEEPKLVQVRKVSKGARAILGDATNTPVAGASMDLVLCVAMSHHLSEAELELALREITRTLRPGGRLMFLDALWNRRWPPGRILWSLDRGSNPRSKEALLSILTKHVRIIRQEEFRLVHQYLLLLASKM